MWWIHQTPQAGSVMTQHSWVTRAVPARAAHQPSSHEVYLLYYYCSMVNHVIGDLLLDNPEVDLYYAFFQCGCYYHPIFTNQVIQGHDQGLR